MGLKKLVTVCVCMRRARMRTTARSTMGKLSFAIPVLMQMDMVHDILVGKLYRAVHAVRHKEARDDA